MPDNIENPESKDLDYFRKKINDELSHTRTTVDKAMAEKGHLPEAVFDLRASLYGLAMEMAGEARNGDLVAMQELIKPKVGELGVDIAAGTGFLTKKLGEWTKREVIALDPSKNQLEILKRQCPEVVSITGFPEDPRIIDTIPEGQVDFVTSFGGLHHNHHQQETFANIARMLKPGGRFCSADVRGDTILSSHFDEVVDKKCLTKHDRGEWLTEDRLVELCKGLPLEIVRTEMRPLTWNFHSLEEMALFFKGLHAYDLPEEEVIKDLKRSLGYEEEDGLIKLNWPMLFFEIRKK